MDDQIMEVGEIGRGDPGSQVLEEFQCSKKWFPNFCERQNHLRNLGKHRF